MVKVQVVFGYDALKKPDTEIKAIEQA